jgi:two-component system sensor histidine kinase BaeS
VRSLRAREFVAIALAVLASVAVTLVVAVVLVRRSVREEALKSLSRQAALIAAQERARPTGQQRLASLGAFFDTQQERLAIVSLSQASLLLPPNGAAALRAGRPAQGSLDTGDRSYLYAARRSGDSAIVMLRSTKLAASDWRPFTLAFVIAALVGAALAAIAAFVFAGAITRPIARVARATRGLASGERHGPVPVEGPTEVAALAEAFNDMERELERAKDAERSFLLSVSHELKTPIASIRGHAEGLLDHVIDAPKAGAVVVQEAKRLERLVHDLLDLARLNQRAFKVVPAEVDLAELAAEACARHEEEARRVGVALVEDAPEAAPATADPDRVVQVLSNLIENAVRSTPAGGTVTVSAEGGALRVSDTGPGLDPDDLPRAFERFFLYSRYVANRSVGTGLGLAVVKELTEAMGGTVTVESAPGRGTTFTVTLPRTEVEQPAPAVRR